MLQRQLRPGWMALDVQAGAVRMAHVVRTRGAPRLELLRRVERSGSESDDLGRMRRSFGLQRFACITAADRAAYQIVQMNAPAVGADEMNAALRWGVKDSLDFPVEDALIDSFSVPADGAPPGRPRLVLTVAARRDRIGSRLRAFQRSGIPLKVIDIAEAAQRNLATLFEQTDRALAFLAFDAHGGLLTFTRNGELYAVRHIDATPVSLGAAASAESREAVHERIALELQRSLDNFDRLFSQLPLQRVVVAPCAGAAALIAFLRDNLAPPIEGADLAGVLACDAAVTLGSEAEQAEWLRPIGLALRDDAGAPA